MLFTNFRRKFTANVTHTHQVCVCGALQGDYAFKPGSPDPIMISCLCVCVCVCVCVCLCVFLFAVSVPALFAPSCWLSFAFFCCFLPCLFIIFFFSFRPVLLFVATLYCIVAQCGVMWCGVVWSLFLFLFVAALFGFRICFLLLCCAVLWRVVLWCVMVLQLSCGML